MKNKSSMIKELWSHPKYRILIKLGGYFVFFVIFFILAAVGRNNVENQNNTENKGNNISYNTMKNNILKNSLKVKYQITSNNESYIEGTIINNVFTGTLEQNSILKKIKIEAENVYLIEKNNETQDETLLNDINLIYIFPANIINILNENSSIMKQNDSQKIYSYTIDNKAYSVYTENNSINKIILLDGSITYELQIEIIK